MKVMLTQEVNQGRDVGQVAGYEPQALERLRARIASAGSRLPSASMKSIGWMSDAGLWRVQLPAFAEGLAARQTYFSPRDYGGIEAALIEAQYFRDEVFACRKYKPEAQTYLTRKRAVRGLALPISCVFDPRRQTHRVIGFWMETVDGVRKQRKVSRSVGRHGFEDAWYEVAAIVSAKVGLPVEAPPKGLLCTL